MSLESWAHKFKKKAIKGNIQARLSAFGVHTSAGRGATTTTPPDGADRASSASESQRTPEDGGGPAPPTRRTRINSARSGLFSTLQLKSFPEQSLSLSLSPQLNTTTSKRHDFQHRSRGQPASPCALHRGPEETSQRTEKGTDRKKHPLK